MIKYRITKAGINVETMYKGWKRILKGIIVGILLLLCGTPVIANAQEVRANRKMDILYYLQHGIKAAYHNMHLIYEAYFNEIGILEKQAAGYVAIEQEWEGNELISRTYLNKEGKTISRQDGYAKAIWKENENGVKYICFESIDGHDVDIEGLNLLCQQKTDSDGWSEWMTPKGNTPYELFYIGDFYLGEKKPGDVYTCQIEIEFSDVSAVDGKPFEFKMQGRTDNGWEISNPWWKVAYCTSPPKDGVYPYTKTVILDEDMAEASKFEIGFRCDNWSYGSFRYRMIKIEKGSQATEWTPGY